MILMANSPTRVRSEVHQLDPTVEYILSHASCEMLLLSQGQSAAMVRNTGKMEEAAVAMS